MLETFASRLYNGQSRNPFSINASLIFPSLYVQVSGDFCWEDCQEPYRQQAACSAIGQAFRKKVSV